jgi:hypothetical protein
MLADEKPRKDEAASNRCLLLVNTAYFTRMDFSVLNVHTAAANFQVMTVDLICVSPWGHQESKG